MAVLEATALHPRLDVSRKRHVSGDGVERADGRDDEIRDLKGEIRGLAVGIDGLIRRLSQTEARSLDDSIDDSIDEWVGPLPETCIRVLVTASDKVGLLAEIAGIFANEGVNILRARSGVAERGKARIAVETSATKLQAELIAKEIEALSCDYRVWVLHPENADVTPENADVTPSDAFPEGLNIVRFRRRSA
jgi:predicted amino acid-binding ACT domain protein